MKKISKTLQNKSIGDWTRKDFESLPSREWKEDVGLFDAMVILPLRKLHDSGYRLMDFVAVRQGKPFVRLSGCSDVISIDGTGGLGIEKNFGSIAPKGWRIDCLKQAAFCVSLAIISYKRDVRFLHLIFTQ